MLDGLPVGWIGPGSGWAIVGIFVLFMAMGRLVPRSWADDRIHDLKEAHALVEAARQRMADDQKEILEILRALNAQPPSNGAAPPPVRGREAA